EDGLLADHGTEVAEHAAAVVLAVPQRIPGGSRNGVDAGAHVGCDLYLNDLVLRAPNAEHLQFIGQNLRGVRDTSHDHAFEASCTLQQEPEQALLFGHVVVKVNHTAAHGDAVTVDFDALVLPDHGRVALFRSDASSTGAKLVEFSQRLQLSDLAVALKRTQESGCSRQGSRCPFRAAGLSADLFAGSNWNAGKSTRG